jgi:tellurite resistance protein
MGSRTTSRLEHFPNAFFAMVMGLAGFTLATERIEKSLGAEHSISLFLLTFTGIVFALLLGFYLAKAVRYPQAIRWEWNHPVRLCFFPAASIGLILMGTAFAPFPSSFPLASGPLAQRSTCSEPLLFCPPGSATGTLN